MIEPGPITAEELEARRRGCLLVCSLTLTCWLILAALVYALYTLWGAL